MELSQFGDLLYNYGPAVIILLTTVSVIVVGFKKLLDNLISKSSKEENKREELFEHYHTLVENHIRHNTEILKEHGETNRDILAALKNQSKINEKNTEKIVEAIKNLRE